MVKQRTQPRPTRDSSYPSSELVAASAATGSQLVKPADASKASVFKEKGVTQVVGQLYAMDDLCIVTEAVYFTGREKHDGRNGRRREADKIDWRDPATIYDCIIMRDPRGRYLSSYVAAPTGRPHDGFDHGAIPPDLDIEVHGGLTCSAICDAGTSPRRRLLNEARSIGHVPQGHLRYTLIEHATDHPAGHDQAWLAAQLRAIADGKPKPGRTSAPPPPLGLHSKKAS